MTDYGRLEAGAPTGSGDTFTAGFNGWTRIIIPNNAKITSLSFYASAASPTSKYRAQAYLAAAGTNPLLCSSAEVVGITSGLNTVSFTAPYQNVSGGNQTIDFGISMIIANMSFNTWNPSVGTYFSDYVSNAGSDTPAASWTFSTLSNATNRWNFWVTGTVVVNYAFALGTGSYTYTGNALTVAVARIFSLATGAYAYTGSALTFTKVKLFALGTGSYAYTGKAMTFTRHIIFSLGTGVYSLTGRALSFVSGLRALAVATFTGPPTDPGDIPPSLFSQRGVGSTVVPKRPPPPTPKD